MNSWDSSSTWESTWLKTVVLGVQIPPVPPFFFFFRISANNDYMTAIISVAYSGLAKFAQAVIIGDKAAFDRYAAFLDEIEGKIKDGKPPYQKIKEANVPNISFMAETDFPSEVGPNPDKIYLLPELGFPANGKAEIIYSLTNNGISRPEIVRHATCQQKPPIEKVFDSRKYHDLIKKVQRKRDVSVNPPLDGHDFSPENLLDIFARLKGSS